MLRHKQESRWTLADLLAAILGPPQSRDGSSDDYWHCPFHGDVNPSLHVMPDGRRWNCFGCGEFGDAIDLVRKLRPSFSYPTAKHHLETDSLDNIAATFATSICPTWPTCPSKVDGRRLTKKPAIQTQEWRDTALEIVSAAQRCLKSRHAADAKEFLSRRGISTATARKARLGYVESHYIASGLKVPGDAIAIPWFTQRRLAAVNFRRLSGEPRYQLLSGSGKGPHYPDTEIDPTRPVVLCEGEFDCLLANQEAGDVAQFVTLGSASDKPTPTTLATLSVCFPLFLAHDADAAGDRAAESLIRSLPRAVRLRPPAKAKDVGGIFASGGDLRRWIKAAIERATRTKRRK